MSAQPTISRKRSRIAVDSDDETQQHRLKLKEPSPALSTTSDTLKRTRTQCDLEELGIVDPEAAWAFDIDALLASHRIAAPTTTTPSSTAPPTAHDNWARYKKGESSFILCVQGNMQLHYELLCTALPALYHVSPSLQALVLCHDTATHRLSPAAPFALPLVQAAMPCFNHFVRLGLLHPLGGGEYPLDALVVIDRWGRRRLVLPFGWGAGKHADTLAGRSIQRRMMELLRGCVEALERER